MVTHVKVSNPVPIPDRIFTVGMSHRQELKRYPDTTEWRKLLYGRCTLNVEYKVNKTQVELRSSKF